MYANGVCRPQIYMDNRTELEIPIGGVSGEFLKYLGWVLVNNDKISECDNYNVDIEDIIY